MNSAVRASEKWSNIRTFCNVNEYYTGFLQFIHVQNVSREKLGNSLLS